MAANGTNANAVSIDEHPPIVSAPVQVGGGGRFPPGSNAYLRLSSAPRRREYQPKGPGLVDRPEEIVVVRQVENPDHPQLQGAVVGRPLEDRVFTDAIETSSRRRRRPTGGRLLEDLDVLPNAMETSSRRTTRPTGGRPLQGNTYSNAMETSVRRVQPRGGGMPLQGNDSLNGMDAVAELPPLANGNAVDQSSKYHDAFPVGALTLSRLLHRPVRENVGVLSLEGHGLGNLQPLLHSPAHGAESNPPLEGRNALSYASGDILFPRELLSPSSSSREYPFVPPMQMVRTIPRYPLGSDGEIIRTLTATNHFSSDKELWSAYYSTEHYNDDDDDDDDEWRANLFGRLRAVNRMRGYRHGGVGVMNVSGVEPIIGHERSPQALTQADVDRFLSDLEAENRQLRIQLVLQRQEEYHLAQLCAAVLAVRS